jgi:hypothetical protein
MSQPLHDVCVPLTSPYGLATMSTAKVSDDAPVEISPSFATGRYDETDAAIGT